MIAQHSEQEDPSRDVVPVRLHDVATTQRIPATQLATLLRVSGALSSTLDLEDVLQIAVESATEVLELDTGAIYTIEGDALFLGATTPALPSGFPEELRHASLADHPHILESVSTGAPICIPDVHEEVLTPAEQVAVESRGLVTVLYVPLIAGEVVTGVLILGTTSEPREFCSDHVDLCRILAYDIAMAVTNAQLYASVVDAKAALDASYDATIAGWSTALEMRDEGTAGHTVRVTELSVELARRMGVPESQMPHIRRGALLHDIGKMVVPDSILHKPGQLTPAEWDIMRTHPGRAREFLASIEYLAPALAIPYCHHERWDGTGYPRGLKGEEIPLIARIFAIVDVMDALTSDRPYRPAWSRDKALLHIREQSGLHFDPAVVEAFLEVLKARGEFE